MSLPGLLQTEDIAAASTIHLDSWRRTYGPLMGQNRLDPCLATVADFWHGFDARSDDHVFFGEKDGSGALIGFGLCWWHEDCLFLDNLHVQAERQSQGIGTRLLIFAKAFAHSRGKPLVWTVLTENERAIQFYDRAGAVRGEQVIEALFGLDMPAWRYSYQHRNG